MPKPPRTVAQRHASRMWGDARSSLLADSVELSIRELRQRVEQGGHVLGVYGNPGDTCYDGYPADIWPVSVREENFRPHRWTTRLEVDEWYKVLVSRGWKPYRSSRIPTFIFSRQVGPAAPEIEVLRRYPFNPQNPRCSLKFRKRRRFA